MSKKYTWYGEHDYIYKDGESLECEEVCDELNRLEAENERLRDCLKMLYHNHGHGNFDEACGLWGVILDKFNVERPDEETLRRFYFERNEKIKSVNLIHPKKRTFDSEEKE